MRRALPAIVSIALIFLVGCGYYLVSSTGSSVLPPNIKRIAVSLFTNRTYRYGAEEVLTNAVISELIARKMSIVGPRNADAILEGEIIEITSPELVSEDKATGEKKYKVTMRVSVRLRDLASDEIVWRLDELSSENTYTVKKGEAETADSEQMQILYDNVAKGIRSALFEGW
ncbi:MAG: LptE family protein [bacterium]